MPEAPSIVCIGGAAVDRKYRAFETVRAGTSNPVRGETGFGGVARNVAENLVRLGKAAALVSLVGNDEAGRALKDHLDRASVDTAGLAAIKGEHTAEYAAVLDPDGSLAVAFADMAIFEAMTPDWLEPLTPRLKKVDWLFVDCNLPAETLRAVIKFARRSECRLAVDAVSVAKSARLPKDLTGIDLLFVNCDEAAALLGGDDHAPENAVRRLLERGPVHVVLMRGADGCLAGGPDGLQSVPAPAAEILDVTGAGDAMVAGTLSALVGGGMIADALEAGSRAAAATLSSRQSVIPRS
jgi:pseudouridine kinase